MDYAFLLDTNNPKPANSAEHKEEETNSLYLHISPQDATGRFSSAIHTHQMHLQDAPQEQRTGMSATAQSLRSSMDFILYARVFVRT